MSLAILNNTLTIIGNMAAVVGMIAGWTFVLRYRRTPWRMYIAGKHLMHMTFGLTLILTYILLFQAAAFFIDPANPWVNLVLRVNRVIIFAWISYQLVVRMQLLDLSRYRPDRLLTPVPEEERR